MAGEIEPDPLAELLQAVDRVVAAHGALPDYLRPTKGTRLAGELQILETVRRRWLESRRVAWSGPPPEVKKP